MRREEPAGMGTGQMLGFLMSLPEKRGSLF